MAKKSRYVRFGEQCPASRSRRDRASKFRCRRCSRSVIDDWLIDENNGARIGIRCLALEDKRTIHNLDEFGRVYLNKTDEPEIDPFDGVAAAERDWVKIKKTTTDQRIKNAG